MSAVALGVAALLNFSLLCVSCDASRSGLSQQPVERPSQGHVAESSPTSSRFQLRVGDTLRVRLRASPPTGYTWTFQGPLPPSLRMESDPGMFPIDAGKEGIARTQAWTFRAQRSGHARLRFAYGRAWEPSSAASERREIEVIVE
jgi:predicted secreted protein